jgi:hypothetical protein
LKIPQAVIKPFGVLEFPKPIENPCERILEWEFSKISITYPMVRHVRDCTCDWCTRMNSLGEFISK